MEINRIKLLDLLTQREVWKYYQMYKGSEFYTSEQIKLIQSRKLKELLIHCYRNVPFYRDLMYSKGINPINLSGTEILKEFPIIDKSLVLKNHSKFISDNLKSFKGVKTSKTSGSSGQVLSVYTDTRCRSSVWGSFERFYTWMNRSDRDIVVNFKGGHVVNHSFYDIIKKEVLAILNNYYLLDAYKMDERDAINYFRWLQKKQPRVILRGYVQNLYDFAKILKNNNLSLSLKGVTTTAEPLLDIHRNLFEEVFGCDTFDQYGCGEIEGIAYECNYHEGLHITEEHVIVESDQENHLIITDLDNHVFPLIRYKNGDIITMATDKCTCERESQLIRKINGRISDEIIGINGNNLHWGFFHHLLIDSGIAEQRNLEKFRVIQNNLQNIEIQLVSLKLSVDEEKLIIKHIQKALGNINVQISFHNSIPNEENGKFKAVVSYLKSK